MQSDRTYRCRLSDKEEKPVLARLEKNNSNQTCSCPRDWRFSASRGDPIEGPLKAPVHHSTIVLKGLDTPVPRTDLLTSDRRGFSSQRSWAGNERSYKLR